MDQRICQHPECSNEVTGSFKKKYCSPECAKSHWWALNPKDKYVPEKCKCLNCGTEFVKKKPTQKFCSKKCYVSYANKKRHLNKSYDVICGHCNNPFTTKYKKKKYCSNLCAGRERSKRDGKFFAAIKAKCDQCNKDYKKYRRRQRFCSQSCADKFYRHRKSHGICIECGIPFKKSKHKQVTCSETCGARVKLANRKYANIDITKLNGKYKSAFTPQQQREITNIIGIGIAHIGNLQDLNAENCLNHIYNNVIIKLMGYKLYKQEIRHIYRACLIVLDIVRNHRGNKISSILEEDIFAEMKGDFKDQLERVYEE